LSGWLEVLYGNAKDLMSRTVKEGSRYGSSGRALSLDPGTAGEKNQKSSGTVKDLKHY
jgi:hypothetical protein